MDPSLNSEVVNDYVEDLRDALKLGKSLETVKERHLRMSPAHADEINEAYKQIRSQLTLPKSPTSTYDRTHGRMRWYEPSESDAYWPPLRESIEQGLGAAASKSIDQASTSVINGLKPSTEPQHSRGLVLGYVQSGKTTNFMSVIAKAADAGFRLIIVLTGITENLRQQTQDRLDKQLVDAHPEKWHKLTSLEDDFKGDLNGAKLSKQTERFIAVVKKNSHRLRRLNEWILSAGDAGDSVPILVIDDEADQASINVAKREGPESLKAEIERSAINLQIGQLLDHQTTAYIAYTATPFANILIDPNDQLDLYPRDFLVTLPEPAGYFGSRALFGRDPVTTEELDAPSEELDGYDMIRIISDEEVDSIRPPKRKGKTKEKETKVVAGGDSLTAAIRWFVLAASARRVRGQEKSPTSMLIHTSMLTDDHEELERVVSKEIASIKTAFQSGADTEVWQQQWEDETSRVPAELFDLQPVSFSEVLAEIPQVLSEVQVVVDNGESLNRLEYSEETHAVIAIGGNTLARGLTLEGLVSSYFVRRASAYDTLLQMGRWFGFRPGYQDLPRIWMPKELRKWFYDLATIEAELREELRVYMEDGYSPAEVQAKIRLHPDMQVTSRAKMQDAHTASMSFSEKKEQTIKFRSHDVEWLEDNLSAARALIRSIKGRGIEQQEGLYGSPTFLKVPNDLVLDFLEAYHFHSDTRLGYDDAALLKNYVEKEGESGRLRYWNVSVITQSRTNDVGFTDLGLDEPVRNVSRAKLSNQDGDDANIKALVTTIDRLNDIVLDPGDRAGFRKLVEDEIAQASQEKVARKYHAKHVGAGIGHLALYPIDKDSKPRGWNDMTEKERSAHVREPLSAGQTVIGVGIFFPESQSPEAQVDYVVAPPAEDELADYYSWDEQINEINDEDEAALERDDDNA